MQTPIPTILVAPWMWSAAALVALGCGGPADTSVPLDHRFDAQQARSAVPDAPTRFVVLGDGGKGNATQKAVADAVRSVCEARTDEDGPGCGFALYLGDNIYDDGVETVDDPMFQSHFETPYADLDFPFLVVLGNHDYGSSSLASSRSDPQISYTERSQRWTLPSRYYHFQLGPHAFVGLDTNALLLQGLWGDQEQGPWVDTLWSTEAAGWRVVFGHHPYRSNGFHGNAGNYEGLWWLPIVRGKTIELFFERHICGQADVYFSGHDHNLQWLEPTCGTHFLVSGAAAHTTPLRFRDGNPTWFADDSTAGFVWVELLGRDMTAVFYHQDGSEQFGKTVHRIRR
ncbi:MAG: hypothetical protein CL927_06435 [Deltaproteobacteria bacterium]|nr:hypothetical protein [Deltaproteobacteria bacterium]